MDYGVIAGAVAAIAVNASIIYLIMTQRWADGIGMGWVAIYFVLWALWGANLGLLAAFWLLVTLFPVAMLVAHNAPTPVWKR